MLATLVPDRGEPKISLTESIRYETKTTSGSEGFSTWTQTETAARTKFAIAAELPLGATKIGGDTRFAVKLGDFEFAGPLRDDPAYRPGATSARLTKTLPADAVGVRTVVAKVELRWTADRLTAKVTADSPNVSSPAAMAFKDSQVGPFEATAKASLAFGERKAEFDLPLRGRIGRRTVDVPGLSGGATTVDLKGEAKASAG